MPSELPNSSNFQQASAQIPQVDLPALAPFLKTMLWLAGRQVREDVTGLSFRTPDAWMNEPGIRRAYEGLNFDRQARSRDAASKIVGVGHKVLDEAIRQASENPASIASLPANVLSRPLILFTIMDSVTTEGMLVRSVLVGVEIDEADRTTTPVVLRDWQVLERLNSLAEGRGYRRSRESASAASKESVEAAVNIAQTALEAQLTSLQISFQVPAVTVSAILWPCPADEKGAVEPPDDE